MDIIFPTWSIPIIVVLVGILGTFAVTRWVAYRKASVKFQASVLSALDGLYPHPVNWPSDSNMMHKILSNRYPALQAAVVEFHDALPGWRKNSFHRAWLRYCSPTGEENSKNIYHHYLGFDDMPNPKVTFHANVARLLSYAKKT